MVLTSVTLMDSANIIVVVTEHVWMAPVNAILDLRVISVKLHFVQKEWQKIKVNSTNL